MEAGSVTRAETSRLLPGAVTGEDQHHGTSSSRLEREQLAGGGITSASLTVWRRQLAELVDHPGDQAAPCRLVDIAHSALNAVHRVDVLRERF
jgi:hypothetical protein